MVRKKMTLTERRILRDLFENGAGYKVPGYKNEESAHASVSPVLKRKHVQQAFIDALEKLGFDERSLAKGLLKLTRAQKVSFFQYKGVVVSDRVIADNAIRLQALKVIGEWFGIPANININHSGMIGEYDVNHGLDGLSDEELDAIISGVDIGDEAGGLEGPGQEG